MSEHLAVSGGRAASPLEQHCGPGASAWRCSDLRSGGAMQQSVPARRHLVPVRSEARRLLLCLPTEGGSAEYVDTISRAAACSTERSSREAASSSPGQTPGNLQRGGVGSDRRTPGIGLPARRRLWGVKVAAGTAIYRSVCECAALSGRSGAALRSSCSLGTGGARYSAHPAQVSPDCSWVRARPEGGSCLHPTVAVALLTGSRAER